MTDLFVEKCKALHELMDRTCDVFMMAIEGDTKATVQMKGSLPSLLYLMNSMCNSLRNDMTKKFGKDFAENMLASILMTREEMEADVKKRMEKSIPDYLRKLMELTEDDSTDEADDEEVGDDEDQEEEADDDGDDPDLSVRVDLHVHNGDDDSE